MSVCLCVFVMMSCDVDISGKLRFTSAACHGVKGRNLIKVLLELLELSHQNFISTRSLEEMRPDRNRLYYISIIYYRVPLEGFRALLMVDISLLKVPSIGDFYMK